MNTQEDNVLIPMMLHSPKAAIAEQLQHMASDAGLDYRLRHAPAPGPDLVVEVQGHGDEWVPIAIEVCANPRRAPVREAAERAKSVAKRLDAIPAVGLPRVGPGLKRLLRELGVGYVSLDGQIYLKGPGLLIDREVPGSRHKLPWGQSSNLFADKSSLLLRYLFNRPSVSLGVVELSDELGISPGLVSRLASRLRSDGYLVEENGLTRLSDREALLDDWQDFYRRRARRQKEQRSYLHARDSAAVMQQLAVVAGEQNLPLWGLSFQAGASLVAPYAFFSEVHVLLDPMSWDRAVPTFCGRLGLEPVRREANVVLVQPYYKHSWHYGLREIDGLPVVSDLQLFLDLSVYPRRGAEQASRIREGLLAA